MIRKTGKYLWMFMALTYAATFSYADEGSNIVAGIYNEVLTKDQVTSRIKASKSFAVLFEQDFNEQKTTIDTITGWAKCKVVERLVAKYSPEATNKEINAQWESMREDAAKQGLLDEIRRVKYNKEWETLLREAVSEVKNPSGEILTDQIIEQRIRTVFEREKERFKSVFPEAEATEYDIYMVLKSYMLQFRTPEDVEEYFRKMPDSWEDMLAGSHEGLAQEIRLNKVKERLLFERVGEINYSMFGKYLKAVSKDKAFGIEERREQLTKFLSRFTDYVFEDAMFKELKENLKIYDKNTENLFWRQYQEPSLDFYIEKLPAEYGK
jgi:hypothetical protein